MRLRGFLERKQNGLKEKLGTKLALATLTSQRKTQSKREEHDNGGEKDMELRKEPTCFIFPLIRTYKLLGEVKGISR